MAGTTDTERYRANLIKRREGGGIDVSKVTSLLGDMTADECIRNGFWKVNCKQLVGIATATEVGLTADRFPVRFVIGEDNRARTESIMCSGYWRIVDVGGNYAPFTRRGLENDRPLVNLRRAVPDLDVQLWNTFRAVNANITPDDENSRALYASMYDLLAIPVPTTETPVLVRAKFDAIIAHCVETRRIPKFKITDTLFLAGRPGGDGIGTVADRTARYAKETMLTVSFNETRLAALHPSCDEGTYALAAYAIAAMFRYGLYEHSASQEYYTVYLAAQAGSATKFIVRNIIGPVGSPDLNGLANGQELDVSNVRMSKKMTELAPGLNIIAGINHYMLNHTTGGTVASGTLLTFLSMSNIIRSSHDRTQQEDVTSVFYSALHPVNKRAIANLFITESHVTTHGRDRAAPAYEELDLDTFTKIRGRSNPAGSHKAVVCASVLARVLDAGLAPLLPWSEEVNTCIETCRSVMTIGARAHMGSEYYTGLPAQSQSATLDRYLPELAAYIHTFGKGDSLSFSPHLGPNIAASAAMNWSNLLKELKSADISATSVDVIRTFLGAAGKTYFRFDPMDESTWGGVIGQATAAREALSQFL